MHFFKVKLQILFYNIYRIGIKNKMFYVNFKHLKEVI